MSEPLTDKTKRLMTLVGDPALESKIVGLFQQDGAPSGERVRFAVIKMAMAGDFDAVAELFRIDWRDLLVAAEFANDVRAHERWCNQMLEVKNV